MQNDYELALKSLEEIEKGVGHLYWQPNSFGENISTIKSALVQAEKLDDFVKHYNSYRQRTSNMAMANARLVDNIEQLYNRLDKADKEHEALEIIKEKKVNIHFLIWSNCLKDYNSCGVKKLTKYEFDLLKEVFGK